VSHSFRGPVYIPSLRNFTPWDSKTYPTGANPFPSTFNYLLSSPLGRLQHLFYFQLSTFYYLLLSFVSFPPPATSDNIMPVFTTIIYVLHFHFLIEHLFPPLIFPTFQFLFSTSLFFYPHSSSFLSHPSPLFYNSPLHTPETSNNILPVNEPKTRVFNQNE
jgi:hypothetical protein